MKTFVFLLFFLNTSALFADADGAFEDEAQINVDVFGSGLMCGVNSTFVGVNYLRENSLKYEEIVKYFAEASTNGTSLAEIKKFINEKTKFYCQLEQCNEFDIHNLDKNVLGLVLLKHEPISHIVVKRPSENGVVVIDAPATIKEIAKKEFDFQKRITLLLSSEPIRRNTFHSQVTLVSYGVFVFSAIGFLIIFLRRKKKHAE
jgi:hypothetical protein